MRRLATVWGPLIGWCAVIYLVSSRPNLDLAHLAPNYPSLHWYDYPLRKIGHLVEYAILFLLARRAMPQRRAWIFCLLYGVSDECHQMFVLGRLGMASDVVVDGLGAAIPLFWPHVKKLFRRR